MDLIPGSLTAAALGARDRLAATAGRAALPQPGAAEGGHAGAMASAARTAIFADALLGALRARLEELRAAAR